MRNKILFRAIVVLGGLSASAMGPAIAHDHDHDGDHDHARELFESGKIRSLHDVIRMLHQQVPGEIIGVELVPSEERWLYRFQLIAPDGRRLIVDVDAGSAHVLAGGGD